MGTQVVLLVHEGELPRNHPDLEVLKPKLSGVFDIKRINTTNSKIERGEL
jgi:hypothetical protein